MRTIHIDVKDMYVSNVLTMLRSMKDVMIDKINLDTENTPRDREELNELQVASVKKIWNNDENNASVS